MDLSRTHMSWFVRVRDSTLIRELYALVLNPGSGLVMPSGGVVAGALQNGTDLAYSVIAVVT